MKLEFENYWGALGGSCAVRNLTGGLEALEYRKRLGGGVGGALYERQTELSMHSRFKGIRWRITARMFMVISRI